MPVAVASTSDERNGDANAWALRIGRPTMPVSVTSARPLPSMFENADWLEVKPSPPSLSEPNRLPGPPQKLGQGEMVLTLLCAANEVCAAAPPAAARSASAKPVVAASANKRVIGFLLLEFVK